MNEGTGAVVSEGLPPVIGGDVAAAVEASQPVPVVAKGSRMGRWFWGAVKYLVGVLGTQGLTGAVVVIGWSYRVAQRAAWKVWWGRGGAGHGSFTEFLAAREETRGQVRWPNWFVDQEAREIWRGGAEGARGGRVRRFWRVMFGSLAMNFRLGMQGILNVWLFTLPGCLLLWFAWYDGWNNEVLYLSGPRTYRIKKS